jgi:hypothetical protein
MTPVAFHFVAPNGDPIADTVIEIQLSKPDFDVEDSGVFMPRLITATTDSEGKVTVPLLASSALYYVSVYDRLSEAGLFYKFLVTEVTGNTVLRLQDIAVVGDITNVEDPAYSEAVLVEIATARSIVIANAIAAQVSETAADVSEAAALASQVSATASQGVATNQAGIATAAQGVATTKASEASASAATSLAKANISTTKAGEASTSAGTASTQAGVATTKAGLASASASAGATSAAAALVSENNASTSKDAALVSKNAASTSESNALTSKNAAATSETNAGTSASNSATSATNSANSATASANSAAASASSVLDRVLGGLSTVTNAVITASDTVLGAFGRLQAQISNHTSNALNPHDVSKSQVGLSNVDNTTDAAKPVSTAQATAIALKSNLASPTFTGVPLAPTAAVGVNTTQIATTAYVRAAVTALVNSAPTTLDTLNELATALGNDANFSTTLTTNLALKAPLASPTFTGTVSGVTKAMVALGNVDNTSDANKPISTAETSALALKVDNSASNRASIRPSLLLDFANTKQLDSRITFSRASTATVFDEKGVMQTVAAGVPRFDHNPVTGESLGLLMEESRTNLLPYSDNFERSSGLFNAIIFANSVVAPNGEFTGTKLTESFDTAINAHYLAKTGISALTGAHTITIYAKAAGRTGFGIAFFGGSSNDIAQFFNLDNGTLYTESISGATPPDLQSSIIYIGSGWYKCVMPFTGNGQTNIRIYLDNLTGSVAYQGDGVSGIYIWRAGLEAGAFPTSSIETPAVFTGRSSTATFIGSNGLIQTASTGVARYQYTPSDLTIPPYLLLEGAGTNLALYSDDWMGGSLGAGWNMGAGFFRSMVASDHPRRASGFQVCAYGPNSGVETFSNSINKQTLASLGAAGTYCIYADFKALGATTSVRFFPSVVDGGSGGLGGVFSLTDASVISDTFLAGDSLFSSAMSISSLGNGWYRCVISFVTTRAIGNMYLRAFPYIGSSSLTGDGTSGLLGTGLQLLAGSYPTSPIPTTTAQVTRAADTSTSSQVTRAADVAVIDGVNFSNFYRQDEGTFVVAYKLGQLVTNADVLSASNGTSAELIQVRYSSSSAAQYSVIDGGAVQSSMLPSGFSTPGVEYVRAIGYKANDFAQSIAGNAALTDTTGTLPTVNRLHVGTSLNGTGQLNSTIKKIAYYPKRLSNTELQGITS